MTVMQYRLRTLLILAGVLPPLMAGIIWLVIWAGAWMIYWWVRVHTSGIRGFVD
jgi:hypothetical protein